jgi:4-hydroxy-tetrahydrodipicolinate reductase
VGADRIISVRDPAAQEHEIGIPSAVLSRHACHKITIRDANVSISIETKVLGKAPYASGLAQIIEGIRGRNLEPRIYDVLALIHNGWV